MDRLSQRCVHSVRRIQEGGTRSLALRVQAVTHFGEAKKMKKRFAGVRSIGAAVAALSIAVITLPAVSSTLSAAVGAVPGLSALSASPASAAGALNCTGYIYNVTTEIQGACGASELCLL